MTATDEHAERFTHLQPLLFTIVYEILGSTSGSDDVLRDSYLRWADVDLAVRHIKSYLAQLVTGQRSTRCGPVPVAARTTSARGCPIRCCSTIAMPRPMWCSPSRSRWDCGGCEAVQPSLPPDAKAGEWCRPSRRRLMLGPSKHLRA